MSETPRSDVPPLERAFDGPEQKARYVARLFATIADRYDLITVVLSYGQDRRWKRRLIELAALTPGESALDLACGTGDLTHLLAARGVRAVGLDLTPRMAELARARTAARAVPVPRFLVGDMMRLPCPDAAFDIVTVGYGLRNVPELGPAVDEIRRVLRPGGRLLALDFDRPESRAVRAVYLGYLSVVGRTLGFLLHADPDTYRYIPVSIAHYPGARAVAGLLERHGFSGVRHVPVLGGLMAIHVAHVAV